MIERGFLVAEIANLEHQKALFLGKAAIANDEANAFRKRSEQADGAIQSYQALIAKIDREQPSEGSAT